MMTIRQKDSLQNGNLLYKKTTFKVKLLKQKMYQTGIKCFPPIKKKVYKYTLKRNYKEITYQACSEWIFGWKIDCMGLLDWKQNSSMYLFLKI